MEELRKSAAAVLITGIVVCGVVSVVSIVKGEPVKASLDKSGGLIIATGAAAVCGRKVV